MSSNKDAFVPYEHEPFSNEEMLIRSRQLRDFSEKRRSIRFFSDKDFPESILEEIILTANTAPSGAHKQPWTFCLVRDKKIKQKIREAAEKEEYDSYHGRMSETWLKDLEPFGTNWEKPFIETVPYLIIVFKRVFELDKGEKKNNYYVNESVGIACGMLINAIHNAGLCTLTHTPSPMNFLSKILNRPENERPYLLLPVGLPQENCEVPNIKRKSLDEILVKY
ncbi:MAG: nitroreductase family protein [Cytophagales bacterium]